MVQDSTNIAGDYALSDYDARHRYVLSAIWELPVQGQPAQGGLADRASSPRARPATRSPSSRTSNFTGNANHPARPAGHRSRSSAGPEQWYSNGGLRPARRRLLHARARSSRCPCRRTASSTWATCARNARHRARLLQHRPSLIKKTRMRRTHASSSGPRRSTCSTTRTSASPWPPHGDRRAARASGVITNTRLPTGDSGSARQIQFAVKVLF